MDILCVIFWGAKEVSSQTYTKGDQVPVYVNKVGPYHNPQETYHYYNLPVCRPNTEIQHNRLTLEEVLDGDSLALSQYDLHYRQNSDHKVLCNLTLTYKDITTLRVMVTRLYIFQFVVDDLPIRGFLGHLEEEEIFPHQHKVYLWPHLHFNIGYNGMNIIYVNVSTSKRPPVFLDEIAKHIDVSFSYSVKWHETNTEYKNRDTRMQDNKLLFQTMENQWLLLFNSLVLVVVLLGFVFIILMHVLKNDFTHYNLSYENEESSLEVGKGWKVIHGDVFRFPKHKSLFCAILGVGTHFLFITVGILLMGLFGMFDNHQHDLIKNAVVVLHATTSWISGYVASSMYTRMGGTQWLKNIHVTAGLFVLPFFIICSVINSYATYTTTCTMINHGHLLALIGYPLTILGGFFGRIGKTTFDAPCQTISIPREIPASSWYNSSVMYCIIGGFIPFSAIFVELCYLYATVWGRQQLTLYWILLVVFIILLCVTTCISVVLTYFQLSAENHSWWWRSVISTGSTGGFMFLYSLSYYFKMSRMFGTLQTIEFFGYTILACYIVFLMVGTVAFFASLKFIRYIYVNIKVD